MEAEKLTQTRSVSSEREKLKCIEQLENLSCIFQRKEVLES